MRVGLGYDIHKLVKNRKLILGGIEIPFCFGLLGHSDGDVIIHALADAILGALAYKDLGILFPSSNPKYKNIAGSKILEKIDKILLKNKYKINNIDINIIAEKPDLQPFYNKMCGFIAKILKIKINQISIKARTNEKLGIIGAQKAIASLAIVSIISSS